MSEILVLRTCECGCGEITNIVDGKPNRYIHGHAHRGKTWDEMYSQHTKEELIGRLKDDNPGFKKGDENWSRINGAWNKNLTKETDDRVMNLAKAKEGKKNPMSGMVGELNHFYGHKHTDESKDKIRKSLEPKLHLCLDYSKRKPNYMEQLLDSWLQEHFPNEFKFVGNGKFIIDGKCPDFINCNGKKEIIEFFGHHWHPPEDEPKRKAIFAKYGYRTLIIWGNEMKQKENVLAKVNEFIGGEK